LLSGANALIPAACSGPLSVSRTTRDPSVAIVQRLPQLRSREPGLSLPAQMTSVLPSGDHATTWTPAAAWISSPVKTATTRGATPSGPAMTMAPPSPFAFSSAIATRPPVGLTIASAAAGGTSPPEARLISTRPDPHTPGP